VNGRQEPKRGVGQSRRARERGIDEGRKERTRAKGREKKREKRKGILISGWALAGGGGGGERKKVGSGGLRMGIGWRFLMVLSCFAGAVLKSSGALSGPDRGRDGL
jgi:hypothetical protein